LSEHHYIDTSFLAPYYLPEASSDAVEKKLQKLPGGSLVISPLVRAEFASLLCRKCREREMDRSGTRRVMTALDRHLEEGVWRVVAIGLRDFEKATEWIMAMKYPLRAPDALHIAVEARPRRCFLDIGSGLS